jgi:DNA mismatch repair protein MSH6
MLRAISRRFNDTDLPSVPAQEAQTESGNSSYGICILDAATGRFELTAFEDDVCRTKLETLFRQLRPRELVFSKASRLSLVESQILTVSLPLHFRGISASSLLGCSAISCP